MESRRLAVCAILLCLSGLTAGQVSGPPRGTLIIAGGGRLPEKVVASFIDAAGGKEAPIVVIPTAGGLAQYGEEAGDFLRKAGATQVRVMHTYDKQVASSDTFVQVIQKASGVWFSGGRQWRLVDAYGGTRSEEAFRSVLEKGGTIGGTSAGATIQGDYLIRGDTRNNTILMGDHESGFAFLRQTIIDQHVLARNRAFDMFEVLAKKPGMLGIGLDEGTAVRVTRDIFQVLGDSYVLVYDGKDWNRDTRQTILRPPGCPGFYFLREGDQYDLAKREVLQSSRR